MQEDKGAPFPSSKPASGRLSRILTLTKAAIEIAAGHEYELELCIRQQVEFRAEPFLDFDSCASHQITFCRTEILNLDRPVAVSAIIHDRMNGHAADTVAALVRPDLHERQPIELIR